MIPLIRSSILGVSRFSPLGLSPFSSLFRLRFKSTFEDGAIRVRKDQKKRKKWLDFNPEPANPEQAANLQRFLEAEEALIKGLDRSRLTEQDWAIHEKHQEAIKEFQLMYVDPISGLQVFTRLRHFLKNRCCGSACRHCVYDHVKVKPEKKATRQFNTAFWQDKPRSS